MSTLSPDILIAGAGLGGLTVAAALARAPDGPTVWVVDPREAWDNDRTWCFWVPEGDPLLRLATRRWDRWRVVLGERAVVRSAPGEVYAHVPAEAVYRASLEGIARSSRVRMLRGRVGRVHDAVDRVVVEVDGEPVHAGSLVDTRPPSFVMPAATGQRRTLQHFLGWHVQTSRPCFDPEVVGLMEFLPGPGVHFRYVLPYSRTEALVEDTWFTDTPHPPHVYRAALRTWLEDVAGTWEVLREEQGVLPMTTESFDPHPSPRVWRVGLAGGAARPATGYAFLATRVMAEQVARRLVLGSSAGLPAVRSPRIELLDGVFLEWMHHRPELAPAGFFRMFDRVDPGALVRFLSNRSTTSDELQVVSGLAPVAGTSIFSAAFARL